MMAKLGLDLHEHALEALPRDSLRVAQGFPEGGHTRKGPSRLMKVVDRLMGRVFHTLTGPGRSAAAARGGGLFQRTFMGGIVRCVGGCGGVAVRGA